MGLTREQWTTVMDIALEMGAKSHAVRKWRARRHVPYKWRLKIIPVAALRGVPILSEDFRSSSDEI